MKSKTLVSKILYSIFTQDAIYYAAHQEMTDDIAYCKKQKPNKSGFVFPKELSERDFLLLRKKYDLDSGRVYGPPTYNEKNFETFKKQVDALKLEDIFEGLTETEKYAVLNIYYNDI